MDLFRAIFADSDESSSSSSDENSDEEDPELDRQKSDGEICFFSQKTFGHNLGWQRIVNIMKLLYR